MTAFLTQRIKAREQKIEKISRQIRDLQRERRETEAELRAYQDVLENVGASEGSATEEPQGNMPDEVDTSHSRSVRMSDTWREILLGLLKRYPNASHVDEVRSIVKELGKEMSDESLRSQLSVYTKNGWLERTGTALYLITSSGAAVVGQKLPTEIEEEDEDEKSSGGIFS